MRGGSIRGVYRRSSRRGVLVLQDLPMFMRVCSAGRHHLRAVIESSCTDVAGVLHLFRDGVFCRSMDTPGPGDRNRRTSAATCIFQPICGSGKDAAWTAPRHELGPRSATTYRARAQRSPSRVRTSGTLRRASTRMAGLRRVWPGRGRRGNGTDRRRMRILRHREIHPGVFGFPMHPHGRVPRECGPGRRCHLYRKPSFRQLHDPGHRRRPILGRVHRSTGAPGTSRRRPGPTRSRFQPGPSMERTAWTTVAAHIRPATIPVNPMVTKTQPPPHE